MNVAGEELSQSACLAPEKSQRKKKKKKRCFEFCNLLRFVFRQKVVRIEKTET